MGKQSLKLMIVDDNARFRTLVRTILTDNHDQVLELEDGVSVTQHYSEFHPDWVLMDVSMKHVDGLEATRQLLTSYPEAKVIFLSDFTNKQLVAKGIALGARAYLSKEDIFAVNQYIRSEPTISGEHHANHINH